MPTNPVHLRPPARSAAAFLRYYARRKQRLNESVFCLQVGANDGKVNDPVHVYFRDFGWNGLLVEPLPDVFENELKATYAGNPRVRLENVALASAEGELPLYRVAISRARWASGLSGFRRDNIQAHIDNGYIARRASEEGIALPADPSHIIETVLVRTVTVDSLLAKHGVRHFDVLCVDTEGFDFEILKLVDLDRYRPDVIVFESKNLSDADYVTALQVLRTHGYHLYWDRGDTLATRTPFPQFEHAKSAARARLRSLFSPAG
jgi:FkbM family methyltransferase